MSDKFPRPSGNCITDRMRQRKAEAQRQAHSSAPSGSALEMDANMLRCLLWLLLHRHGGVITFTRADLDGIPTKGDLLLTDGSGEMTLTAIVPNDQAEL